MRILVVTQYFWPEQFKINDLCHGLVERGHEVTVYTGLPNYPAGEIFEGYSFRGPYFENYNGCKVIRSPLIPRGKNKSILLALNYISFCLFASLLAPFLVRGKFDKIFIYEPSPITVCIPAILLKYLKKAPAALWVNDLWPESLEASGIIKNPRALKAVGRFVQWIYKHLDKILITSRGFRNNIEALGVPPEKVLYWPQWAEKLFQIKSDISLGEDFRLPVPAEDFVVMFAGNIGTSQDFETIVKAATLLRNEKSIHFVVLGDGLMRAWAENEVMVNQLQSTFHLLGQKPIESMPAYFAQADVLMVTLKDTPLFSITVPAKVQAYLATGKPILAAINGEGAQIITEWNAGLTCPASNPEMMAEQIKVMASLKPDELGRMGTNALACYNSEFEREKLISILENELQNLG